MILGSSKNIEDCIVIFLSQNASATAKKLHQDISKNFRKVSIQAIYKELNKLLEEGVLWKRGSHFGLSASWIFNFSTLADNMYNTLTEDPNNQEIIPKDGEKLHFRFSSLARLDDFWIHLIIVLLQNSEGNIRYQWLAHPWFNLIHSHKSFPLHRALKAAGFCVKNIIGGDNFLDHRANKVSTKDAYEYSYAPGPFHDLNDTHYSVCETYLFTVKIDQEKCRDIENLYQSIESMDDLDIASVVDIINRPCTIRMTIEANTKKQKQILKKFKEYFEVS